MNILKKALTVVLALTVAATLASCGNASAKPEPSEAPPVTTTQPPQEENPQEDPSTPGNPTVDSEWSADEVSVLTSLDDRVQVTATIWDGKTIDGPTPHPWLGGGDLAITLPDGQYGRPEWIVVPFRIEAVNITSSAISDKGIGGGHAGDTEVFVVLEGVGSEYTHIVTHGGRHNYVEQDIEPGQSVVATGYLLMSAVDVTYDSAVGAAWTILSGENIDASIIWEPYFQRYMPREAAMG